MVWRDREPERSPYRDLDRRDERGDHGRRPGPIARCFTAIGRFIESILSLGFSRRQQQSRQTTTSTVRTVRGSTSALRSSGSPQRSYRVNSLDELPPEIRQLAEEALREAEVNRRSPDDEARRDPDALVSLESGWDDAPSLAEADLQRFSRSVRREVRIENGQRTERIIITDADGRERRYDSIDDLPEADRRWLKMIESAADDDDRPIDFNWTDRYGQ